MASVAPIAGAVGVTGLAVCVASLAYLHLADTGLSPVRNAVSQYGITRVRGGYRAATISLGCAGGAAAVGIDAAVHGQGVALVVGLLVVFGIARLIISWFPMDAPGTPRTATGAAHGLIAIVTFGSAAIAALRFGQLLTRGGPWHAFASTSTACGWAMVTCIAGLTLSRSSPALRRRFGAIERVLYVAIIGWLAVIAILCIVWGS